MSIQDEHARAVGWDVTGDDRYWDVTCALCRVKRVRAAEGKPEPRIEIPGQLDLLTMVPSA